MMDSPVGLKGTQSAGSDRDARNNASKSSLAGRGDDEQDFDHVPTPSMEAGCTAQRGATGPKRRRKSFDRRLHVSELVEGGHSIMEGIQYGEDGASVPGAVNQQGRQDGYHLRKRRSGRALCTSDLDGAEKDETSSVVNDGVMTRGMKRRSEDWLSALPEEIWGYILSHLEYNDIGKALCACQTFNKLTTEVWRHACEISWPQWTAVVGDVPDNMFSYPEQRWRKCYEMLSLRAAESENVSPWGDTFGGLQKQVTQKHRAVLVEWLLEVSLDFKLESSVIFQAVRFLDYYLREKSVERIFKFQALGITTLRFAVKCLKDHMPKVSAERYKCLMDPSRYADVCAGAATVKDIVDMTKHMERVIPKHIQMAPNAKMYLRCLWYTVTKGSIEHFTCEHMHVYVLAAFLLDLSQIDIECSTFTHSSLAAAALSLAFEIYGKEPWPMSLRAFSSYSLDCLEKQRKLLARRQAVSMAVNARQNWKFYYAAHNYQRFTNEWEVALDIMGSRSDAFLRMAWGENSTVPCMWEKMKLATEEAGSYAGDLEKIAIDILYD